MNEPVAHILVVLSITLLLLLESGLLLGSGANCGSKTSRYIVPIAQHLGEALIY